jgi:hypothetical protein
LLAQLESTAILVPQSAWIAHQARLALLVQPAEIAVLANTLWTALLVSPAHRASINTIPIRLIVRSACRASFASLVMDHAKIAWLGNICQVMVHPPRLNARNVALEHIRGSLVQ